MKRPGITAFVFTALATGAALVLGAGPAHADRDGTCNSGDICFWNGRAYSGDKLDMTYSDPNHTDERFYGTNISLNDHVTSLRNYDANCKVALYRNANYGDLLFTLDEAGSSDRRGNLMLTGYNDSISSHQWFDC